LKLTKDHIIELVIFEKWTDKFTRACVAGISLEMDEMISEGLVKAESDRYNAPMFHISITERGRQALRDVGPAAIVEVAIIYGKPHLLSLCEPKLTLSDLPLLFASKNSKVRDFASKKYEELSDGTDLQAYQLVANTSDVS